MACYKIKRNFDYKLPNEFVVGDIVKYKDQLVITRLNKSNMYKVLKVDGNIIYINTNDYCMEGYHHTMFEKDFAATRESIIDEILK